MVQNPSKNGLNRGKNTLANLNHKRIAQDDARTACRRITGVADISRGVGKAPHAQIIMFKHMPANWTTNVRIGRRRFDFSMVKLPQSIGQLYVRKMDNNS